MSAHGCIGNPCTICHPIYKEGINRASGVRPKPRFPKPTVEPVAQNPCKGHTDSHEQMEWYCDGSCVKVTVYPHFLNNKVLIGDGNVMSIPQFKAARKRANEKCPDCKHPKGDHFGVCRFSKGTMICSCRRNY